MKNNIIIILLILVSGLLFYIYISKPDIEIIELKGDSIIVEVPVPYSIEVPYEIPYEVDTAAIIKDYYSKVKYKQTLPIEDLGNVTVNFELQQNRLQELNYDYKLNLRRFKTHKNSVGVGASFNQIMLSYDRQITTRFDFSVNYMVKDKDLIIGVKYNF